MKSTKPCFFLVSIVCLVMLFLVQGGPVWASETVTPQTAAGFWHTLTLKSDGTLWAWGWNNVGQLGDGTTTDRLSPVQVGTDHDWVSVAAGYDHTLALKSDGTLWAWGRNNYGQLGTSTTEVCVIGSLSLACSRSPIQVGMESDWVSVAAGVWYTLALKSDGSLWAWGQNGVGQLGTSTTEVCGTGSLSRACSRSPLQVGMESDWVSVEAGANHTLALKSDGTLWAWGWNGFGQLGDGTIDDRYSPVKITTVGNGWVSVAAGYEHTLALKSDGTLWAWGWNAYGQLGDGTTAIRLSPVQVGTDHDWVSVAAGESHTLAIKSDGALRAWGSNANGELGTSTTEVCGTGSLSRACSRSPIQVGMESGWVSVAAGANHTLALKSGGTLWAWGDNYVGQLGDGTTDDRHSPVHIATAGNDWVSITAGARHTPAPKSDGTLWAWGRNNYGQLGTSTTEVCYSGYA